MGTPGVILALLVLASHPPPGAAGVIAAAEVGATAAATAAEVGATAAATAAEVGATAAATAAEVGATAAATAAAGAVTQVATGGVWAAELWAGADTGTAAGKAGAADYALTGAGAGAGTRAGPEKKKQHATNSSNGSRPIVYTRALEGNQERRVALDSGTSEEAQAHKERGALRSGVPWAHQGGHGRALLGTQGVEATGPTPGTPPDWWSPFQRPQVVAPLEHPECKDLAPGFDPEILKIRDSIPPLTLLEDLRALKKGQKVFVVVPRFGLGNTLRNWVSAFYWGMFSGRRIVLLHGGRFHGVFTSLCLAFHCAFDHITIDPVNPEGVPAVNETAGKGGTKHPKQVPWRAEKLLKEFTSEFKPREVSMSTAHDALYWDDPIVWTQSYAFWDHWWTTNRTLGRCGCAATGTCGAGSALRGVALHALLSGGPTEDLRRTIGEILQMEAPAKGGLELPVGEELRGRIRAFDPLQGLIEQFDVGLHIRTRVGKLERPGRPFGRCKRGECEREEEKESESVRREVLDPKLWECISIFLHQMAEFRSPGAPRALSIFLATDNEVLRDEFVRRLTKFGAVYFNKGSVAHVGVSAASDAGRLPTMAEFFLLGKSYVIVELDGYLSTFSHFSTLLGNCSLLTFPRKRGSVNPGSCAARRPNMRAVWRRDDPRRMDNYLFRTE